MHIYKLTKCIKYINISNIKSLDKDTIINDYFKESRGGGSLVNKFIITTFELNSKEISGISRYIN